MLLLKQEHSLEIKMEMLRENQKYQWIGLHDLGEKVKKSMIYYKSDTSKQLSPKAQLLFLCQKEGNKMKIS